MNILGVWLQERVLYTTLENNELFCVQGSIFLLFVYALISIQSHLSFPPDFTQQSIQIVYSSELVIAYIVAIQAVISFSNKLVEFPSFLGSF